MNEDVSAIGGHFGVVEGQTSMKHSTAVVAVAADDEISPKKIKLEAEDLDDLAVLKRRILDHKYMRLRSVKDKYSEHVAELFFLQTGGSLLDYQVWRKKPHNPQFIQFVRQHRLDQSQLDDLAVSY